jgi:hypothetical protein
MPCLGPLQEYGEDDEDSEEDSDEDSEGEGDDGEPHIPAASHTGASHRPPVHPAAAHRPSVFHVCLVLRPCAAAEPEDAAAAAGGEPASGAAAAAEEQAEAEGAGPSNPSASKKRRVAGGAGAAGGGDEFGEILEGLSGAWVCCPLLHHQSLKLLLPDMQCIRRCMCRQPCPLAHLHCLLA